LTEAEALATGGVRLNEPLLERECQDMDGGSGSTTIRPVKLIVYPAGTGCPLLYARRA